MAVTPQILNEAMCAYVRTFPRRDRLAAHLTKRGLEKHKEQIVSELDAVLKSAEAHLWSYAGGVPWTEAFERNYRQLLLEKHPWLDAQGHHRRMSGFVNYKKRSIALPPGCKNLIDVLRPRPPRRPYFGGPSISQRDGEDIGKMSDVTKYAQMLFGSKRELFVFVVSSAGNNVEDLFCEVFGLNSESQLHFHYYEAA